MAEATIAAELASAQATADAPVKAVVLAAAGSEIGPALPPVSAADANDTEPEARPEGIEVINVTARRRDESLQEVPLSVTALTRRQLEEQDINSFERVGEFAPNLQFMSQPVGRSSGTVQIGIRGRVQNDSLNTLSNSVGFYIDDVFYGKQVGFPLEFIDVERIEVLKGPQGTLYGKNTPAGAVKVTTRKPTGDWGVETDLNLGRFNYVQTRSTLNFPIFGGSGHQIGDGRTDFGTLSGKATFLYASRDGVYGNSNNGTFPATPFPVGSPGAGAAAAAAANALYNNGPFAETSDGFLTMDRLSGLVNLFYERGAFSLNYNYDIQHIEDSGAAFQMTAVFGNHADGFGGRKSNAGFTSLINCAVLFDTTGACFGDTAFSGLSQYVNTKRQTSVPNAGPDDSKVEIQGHSWVTKYELETMPYLGDVTLKSITGYRTSTTEATGWLQGVPFVLFNAVNNNSFRAVQQEIQAVGNSWGGRFDYVVGLFYGGEEGSQGSGELGSQRLPQLAAYCQVVPAFCGGGVIDLTTSGDTKIDNFSLAPYGQGTYSWDLPNEQELALTLGLRYTHEERKAKTRTISGVYTTRTPGGFAGETTFSDVSPMGSLAWQIQPDKMTYVTVSRGFRSGGFNGRATSASTFGPFDDETVTNAEVGFKTDWLDSRLRLNVTGFWQGWKDMQVTVFAPDPSGGAPLTSVENAGEATFWGAEIEAIAAPIDGILMNIGYGLTHAEFDKYTSVCPVDVPSSNVTGGLCDGVVAGVPRVVDIAKIRPVSHHPEHSITWGATYTLPPYDFGVLSFRLGGYYQSSVNFSGERNQYIASDPWHTLDIRVQLAEIPLFAGDVMATFAVWGKNITDTKYKSNGIDLGALGWAFNDYGERATAGANIKLEWGA